MIGCGRLVLHSYLHSNYKKERFGKFTDSVNLYLTAIDDWHSRQVLVSSCVSLVCCYLELSFLRLCDHIISEF